MRPIVASLGRRDLTLATAVECAGWPCDPRGLLPAANAYELEIGFGKGRYLLASSAAAPERGFVGVEVAGEYYRLARDRARRRGIDNLLLLQGDAAYVLAALVPPATFLRIHVYFPDPWPKTRHHKRRLLDPETIDLLLAALAPGGELLFATDHLAYGEHVEATLDSHPAVELERWEGPWPDGARTNYEAKYLAEGRPIRRLVARRGDAALPLLHPAGRDGVLLGWSPGSVTEATTAAT